jgi:hypothetical protein
MSDIFISYAREDESRIKPLVAAFEAEGWSVFWDRRIPAGSTWRSHIGAALQQARCVVVAWSTHSVESQWVVEEADDGRMRQVLVPVSLDAVLPPRGFREIQAADLTGWVPGQACENLTQLLGDMRRLLGRPSAAPPPTAAPVAPTKPLTPAANAQAAGHGWRNAIIAIATLALVAIGGYLALRSDAPAPVTTRVPADATPRRPPPVEAVAAGDWLVVAGSFARSERRDADRRQMAMAEAGFEARVIDSSEYQLLAPNLWVVVLGPFDSRETANAALARLKPRAPDAYVKKGK